MIYTLSILKLIIYYTLYLLHTINIGYYRMINYIWNFILVLVPAEARCTFESGFCGWQNTSEEMTLTWKLNKGDRQKFTGPKWDNTYQNRSGNALNVA